MYNSNQHQDAFNMLHILVMYCQCFLTGLSCTLDACAIEHGFESCWKHLFIETKTTGVKLAIKKYETSSWLIPTPLDTLPRCEK